jgi:hypothetical protein
MSSLAKQVNLAQSHRLIKYILMGLVVLVALRYIPDRILQLKEILIIGAISSITFAILDMISPTINIQEMKTIDKPHN